MAVFIDLENLFGGYAKDVGSVPLAAIMEQLTAVISPPGGVSRTTAVRAYANWAQPAMRAYEDDLLAHGIEAVQVFSFTKSVKNAADIQMCVDVLAEAQDRPWTGTFVIVSGDGGFVPLVRRLRQLDKRVVVASTNHAAAGTVNHLLASAADEYHVLEVAPPASPTRPGKPGAPTLAQYRDEIKAAVKANPGMRVGKAVNAGPLGVHLRQKWPATTVKDFGSATLGNFVEQHCGLTVHRPAPAKAPEATPAAVAPQAQPPVAEAPQSKAAAPAKATAPPSSAERAAYLRAVRRLFLNGPMSAAVDAATRMSLATAGSLVRQHVPGKTYSDAGYGTFGDMLRDALAGTSYSLGRDEKHAYVERSPSLLQT
ncbi:NYN domain-containing protein [Sinomonas sp. B1-1]|uniref:NYN domain-containing protein n=1 Tax=Sinomonas sp. B1-1 TaxID=3141454 RepID=UPI003D292AB6